MNVKFIFFLSFIISFVSCKTKKSVDTIFYNAHIYSVDSLNSEQEAFASFFSNRFHSGTRSIHLFLASCFSQHQQLDQNLMHSSFGLLQMEELRLPNFLEMSSLVVAEVAQTTQHPNRRYMVIRSSALIQYNMPIWLAIFDGVSRFFLSLQSLSISTSQYYFNFYFSLPLKPLNLYITVLPKCF